MAIHQCSNDWHCCLSTQAGIVQGKQCSRAVCLKPMARTSGNGSSWHGDQLSCFIFPSKACGCPSCSGCMMLRVAARILSATFILHPPGSKRAVSLKHSQQDLSVIMSGEVPLNASQFVSQVMRRGKDKMNTEEIPECTWHWEQAATLSLLSAELSGKWGINLSVGRWTRGPLFK